jgi:Family of unknown function (DUF6624)
MREDQQVRSDIGSTTAEQTEASAESWVIDADNTAWLKAVIDIHGWPLRSQVGETGALAAWLLAQHADHDVPFQRRCLVLLQQAVAAGEADAVHLAYLTDRVLCAEGRPQRYGTQFWHGPDGRGQLTAQPTEDPARLDERRLAVGLEPFVEYERRLNVLADGS